MKTRFFCESCGAEVSHREKRCPSCGKTFTAVRCPSCGFEGAARQFTGGCPVCGYLNAVPPVAGASSGMPRAGGRASANAPRRGGSRARAFLLPRLHLSASFYRVAAFVLLGLLVALVAVLAFIVSRR
jgi:hypothetical protein